MVILAIFLLYVSMGHMIGLPLPSVVRPENNPLLFALCRGRSDFCGGEEKRFILSVRR